MNSFELLEKPHFPIKPHKGSIVLQPLFYLCAMSVVNFNLEYTYVRIRIYVHIYVCTCMYSGFNLQSYFLYFKLFPETMSLAPVGSFQAAEPTGDRRGFSPNLKKNI